MHTLDLVTDMIPVGTKHNWSRFGAGIYTSACSSSKTRSLPSPGDRATNHTIEADDYFKNIVSVSKVQSRAILVNTVVYGNPRKLYTTDASAEGSLRSGFHSVGIAELCDSMRFD